MRPDFKTRHILIAGGSYWGRGGLERYCERLADVLRSLGCTNVTVHKTNSAVLKANNLFTGLHSFAMALVRLIFLYRNSIRRTQQTVVWLQYGNGLDLVVIVALSLVSRKHLICTLHASDSWTHQRSRAGRLITYGLLRLPTRVFVLAEFQARELRNAGVRDAQKIPTLLPNWVNDEPFPLGRRRSDKVLFVGRVSTQKGFADILHVAKALVDRGELFTMTIVGPMDASIDARRQVDALGLHDTIELVGECDEAGVLRHLCASQILLHPSYVDTYPLVLVEAAVTGMYLIAYDLQGPHEIVSELGAGVTVPIGDRDALTEAVNHALKTNINLVENAKSIRARLSWPNVGEVYLQAVREVLN